MKLPNWFKIVWWLTLTALLTVFLYYRYPDLVAGKATPADIVVFVIWIALLLAPLFNEVSLFGIKLKQDIEELKGFVSAQVTEIRSEVRNAVDIRTTFSPHFNIPAPAADSQLPELEARIKSAVSDALTSNGIRLTQPTAPISAPENTALLFAARFNIERELRRIAGGRQVALEMGSAIRHPPSIFQISRFLVEAELLEPGLASAIREVYSVCSPAIHGEPVTEAQVSFVKDVAPDLIAALHAIP